MNFHEAFNRAKSHPPHVVGLKALELTTRLASQKYRRFVNKIYPTFKAWPGQTRFDSLSFKMNLAMKPQLNQTICRFLNHEFNLLGSGWTPVEFGMEASGVEGSVYGSSYAQKSDLLNDINPSNCEIAFKVHNLISPEYKPINWHRDFKSGYQWSPKTWYCDVLYGHRKGVDIKVPWDLSRCQHLPVLACALKNNQLSSEKIKFEIRNQILDFISQNPPQYGVNWRCTMDVAIRAANWVTTLDIANGLDVKWDIDFTVTVLNSLYDHALHILNNLEKGYDGFRGNHYLANIAGLCAIACFLPETAETKSWLNFSARELKKELAFQFHGDGTNFEGSTSYHRLSSEMVYFSVGFIEAERKSGRGKLDPTYIWTPEEVKKFFLMGEFYKVIERPDGRIPQIGDCDSGRFIDLEQRFIDDEEDVLQSRSLYQLRDVLFNIGSMKGWNEEYLHSLIQTNHFSYDLKNQSQSGVIDTDPNLALKQQYVFDLVGFGNDGRWYRFDEFGVYVFKSNKGYLSFRCGPLGQKGRGGHDHNDQLSIELWYDGLPLILDPGTYLYTADIQWRNRFRSVEAHFTPRIPGVEPCDLNQGAFSLKGNQRGHLFVLSTSEIGGFRFDGPHKISRRIQVSQNRVTIKDCCSSADIERCQPFEWYSPSYGIRKVFS